MRVLHNHPQAPSPRPRGRPGAENRFKGEVSSHGPPPRRGLRASFRAILPLCELCNILQTGDWRFFLKVIEDERGGPQSTTTVDLAIPKSWDGSLARVISNVGSPPVLTASAMCLTAATLSQPGVWLWASIYVVIAVLVPFFYLMRLVRRGEVTDLDVQYRAQRMHPLLITIACLGAAWLLLILGPAHSTLIVLAATSWLHALVILGITLRWKISVHASAAAGAATVAWALLESPLPLLVVPLIAWSRIRLRRHTLLQTVVGALLGFTFFFIATSLMQAG